MTPAESRRALGMTVNQFADALGVSPITVRRWETSPDKASHRVPGAATLTAIKLLKCTPFRSIPELRTRKPGKDS